MEFPQQDARRLVVALLLAGAVALAASSEKPFFRDYLEKHPGVAEDDLLEVSAGDPADRALAVIHHPDLGLDPLAVEMFRIEGAAAIELDLQEALTGSASAGDLFVAVRQRCRAGFPGPGEPAFSSWLYLPAGRLSAWSLQPFGAGCRPEDPLVEASDHAVMQRVGLAVFRPLRRGNFRYGSLAYQTWDDAFGAPTPVTMISRLETSVSARPDDARVHNRLAVGLFAVGERDTAVEALRRAAELEPGWSLPHRNLAIAHLHRGDLAAAARAQRRADEIDGIPTDGERPASQ
jgi:tetratricopeptide (TPR) repeat protein